MPMWRCPHCGTPQAETARCWVCHRSSTACGTCRHYRRSVAAQIGYCGLDRNRQPLNGDEIRPCWEAWPVSATLPDAPPTIGSARPTVDQPRHLEFIEVRAAVDLDIDGVARADVAEAAADETVMPAPTLSAAGGWSLWGDLDR
jgi:hypothetical protein